MINLNDLDWKQVEDNESVIKNEKFYDFSFEIFKIFKSSNG